MAKNEPIRLQKFISQCGIASRRKAEEMILNGSVKVNGKAAVLGDKVTAEDKVFLKGKRIVMPKTKFRYIMLNKPRGFITTMNDDRGRKCVAQLVSNVGERVYPIGRLDKDSEGMLVFTNDGEFANKVMHPRNGVYKIYRVTVRPTIDEEQLIKLETGVEIDGKKTAPAIVHVIHKEQGRVVLEMILHEGKNREIRKMCEAVGLEVARLKRTQIGGVKMGMLKQGDWRDLTENEVKKLLSNPIVNGRTI
ncbi:pseudouridine synthase [Ruminococcus sp. YE282]|jgi:23S rRNA pseudouridine2605 synthase|uniref:pseudouridine synthase n=1 Tax=Ruminococcus sp. YE282 TaxID=3158780 RepID=UPI00087E5773|nr:pseudouridine synthase [Ruminococcus bromii]MEE3497549.1 pseudouridine synthase [Ruminococcus bromii]SCY72936.1 23S rRNA pseudouridine2605 synthase [Ruminococcus bromii]HCB94341.1 rRNA pseudouridine synthase [Ruminococcus sp.]